MNNVLNKSEELIGREELEKLIKNFNTTGKRWTVKAGFDPTSADIHLGHTVLLTQLSKLQKLGATVQLLIGDFTAQIGDPTGKSVTRKVLSKEKILENAKTYQEQVMKILDEEHTNVVFNSTWLNELGTIGLIELQSLYTVSRMLERNDFENRYKSQQPIALSEFVYPLLQGFDSVHLESDLEIGGTDQKFNLLMGRHLQKAYNKKQQSIMMLPILEGLDGVQKMSKSLNNYIGVSEEPNEMFAKIMSISDDLMWKWFNMVSLRSEFDISKLKEIHPKAAKEELGFEIVERFHSTSDALTAQKYFNDTFKRKEIPDDIKIFNVNKGDRLSNAFVDSGICPSNSEFRRKIKDGAIKINGIKVEDKDFLITENIIGQFGKKKFMKFHLI